VNLKSPLELMQTCTIYKTLGQGLPVIFIWCPQFLLLEVWVLNYSLLLAASAMYFTHVLICHFSKLKTRSLHHHFSYRNHSVPSIIATGLFWSFSGFTRSCSRWEMWTNHCTELRLWAYSGIVMFCALVFLSFL